MKPALLLLMAIGTMSAVGCNGNNNGAPTKPAPITGSQWSDPVHIDATRLDFIKTFHAQVNADISILVDVEYKPWLETDCSEWCSFSFTLQQGDDRAKWITFDCDHVAEKIIRPELVPLAQQYCSALRAEGIQYWKAHVDPDEFTDENVKQWRRTN